MLIKPFSEEDRVDRVRMVLGQTNGFSGLERAVGTHDFGGEGLMAGQKSGKPETKSDFLRKVLGKSPDLDHRQVNRRWAQSGHAGEISNALFYRVRSELGIRTEWAWVKDSGPGSVSKPGEATGQVYQFKVTLLDARPPIWRRIQVKDCTLDGLHEHIQTAMGWTNSHLHHFRIGGTPYGDPMLMGENFEEFGYEDSTATILGEVLPRGGQRFRFEYEYDFGDSWRHEVMFEGRLRADPGRKYPLCLEGARACPPEDVGGVWGYADFLEAIADPEHENYEDMRGWIGGAFDPDAFSPAAATGRMRRGLPDWRRMR
jgi:hypothetical protein